LRRDFGEAVALRRRSPGREENHGDTEAQRKRGRDPEAASSLSFSKPLWLNFLCQPHLALRHHDRHRRQPFAFAGARQAVTILDAEQRAMGGAKNSAAVDIEELVLDPIQRPAGMGQELT
jgi:hypothetical protein